MLSLYQRSWDVMISHTHTLTRAHMYTGTHSYQDISKIIQLFLIYFSLQAVFSQLTKKVKSEDHGTTWESASQGVLVGDIFRSLASPTV